MIPKECKRLAEVDFPIAEVSRHAAREKSIRHGHPSTLHLWWARRPLASSRAVLMALLLPDPCDPHCPEEFKGGARKLLLAMRGRPSGWNSTVKTDDGLRQVLLRFIADFANWDNSAKAEYLETGRGLVKAAHPEQTPLVVDPFAGGGSIPLEALRLGCDAFASDLNPVACLILKVMLEDIPRHGSGLADELRKVGAEIKAQAEKELAALYPKDPDGATPIAYLWARTVRCEAPNCGAEIPLMRSMWLCRKPKRKWAIRPNVVRDNGVPPKVELEIFEPKADRDVNDGTVSRAKATCLCCRTVMPPERVRAQLAAQRGGADTVFDDDGNRIGGARMKAVVILKEGQQGRHYRLPTVADYAAIRLAQERLTHLLQEWEGEGKKQICPIPDEPLPSPPGKSERTRDAYYNFMPLRLYGYENWGDLFGSRSKVALAELTLAVADKGPPVLPLLTLAVGRIADQLSNLVRWLETIEAVASTFGRQALPIVWDFCEIVPFGNYAANFGSCVDWIVKVIEAWPGSDLGQAQQGDATEHSLPDQAASIWFTDPPYYDSVPYADLSDFFYTWLKRSSPAQPLFQSRFDTGNNLTPKPREIIDSLQLLRGVPKEKALALGLKVKDRSFYEENMTTAFREGSRILEARGIGSVVFAHKTTEGWEALLSGLIRGGWTITASWPIATERSVRPRAQESSALTASIHLVCRPRPDDAAVGEWADVLRELPTRVGEWMQRLETEGVRGADLVFACIGPALEIYSRYRRVETPDGHEVTLPEYLERVWEVVGREALEQVLGTAEARARNGDAGALEEDARLTALFLWTLQSTGDSATESEEESDASQTRVSGFSLPFDVARRFAQPLGIHLEEWESRIISTEKGVVKLRPVTDRAKELFGESGADALADEIETNATASAQLSLFPEQAPTVRGRSRRQGRMATLSDEDSETLREATTLDRVHAAMLFQASGRTEALRNLLRAEQDRGPEFLRLANALSALYPRGSEEKRLLDGMLLAVPR